VLAGELAAADGNHETGLARYEPKMRGFVEMTQKMGQDSAKVMIPNGRFGVWARTQMFRLLPRLPGRNLLMRRITKAFNGIHLPDYSHLVVKN
jgi:2-polyprenyl-6-methoxyphenol hydroxylase-like FAD-dependent oxidoreductase